MMKSEDLNKLPEAEVIKIAERRLTRARIQMLTSTVDERYPFAFWATAALHLRFKALPHMGKFCPGTIGTDGTYIIYDPYKYGADDIISEKQIMADVAHEVSHCVKGDLWRFGSRDKDLANIAADMRIDPEIINAGFQGPDHGSPQANMLFHDMKNLGRSMEEIYEEIKKNPPPPLQGGGQGAAGPGAGWPIPGDSKAGDIQDPAGADGGSQSESVKRETLGELERRWNIIARQAAEIAKAQGSLPAGYEHLVAPVKPKLNPWELIRHYVSMCRKDDYSWARPNRRSLWRGMALPSLYSEGIGTLVIGIDTSGSCAAVIPTFLGFLSVVLSEVKPEKTIFIECDAGVHAVTEYAAGEELPLQVPVHGYGGTSMRPIWDKVEELGLEPVCAIVMTDLCMGVHDFGEPQPFPVLWLSSQKGMSAPWGEYADLA